MIILDNQALQQMIVQNNHPTINSSMPNNFHANKIVFYFSIFDLMHVNA